MTEILAIVGSVGHWFTPAEEAETKDYIRRYILEHKPDKVISGGATGVDTWAFEIAHEELGLTFGAFYPNHLRWEPDGYKDRNRKIAEYCTSLLRIAHRASHTYGSGWTRDEAARLGKPTVQHDVGKP